MAVSVHTVNLGRSGWVGIAQGANGKLYGAPTRSGTVLKVDPASEATSTFGSFSENYSWAGACVAPNGNVYCIPHGPGSSGVLRVNTPSDTTSLISSDAGSPGGEWSGGAAVGSTIVGVPHTGESVLLIHTATNTTSRLTGIPVGIRKWNGGALAGNGSVYCAPAYHGQVLRINPTAGTWSLFGSLGASSIYKWSNAVRAHDGYIYCGPVGSSSILRIDPSSDSTSLISVPGHSPGGGAGWSAAISGSDQLIYLLPVNSGSVRTFDPFTGAFATIATGISGNYQHAVQVGSRIFAPPHEGTNLIVIDGLPSRRARAHLGLVAVSR